MKLRQKEILVACVCAAIVLIAVLFALNGAASDDAPKAAASAGTAEISRNLSEKTSGAAAPAETPGKTQSPPMRAENRVPATADFAPLPDVPEVRSLAEVPAPPHAPENSAPRAENRAPASAVPASAVPAPKNVPARLAQTPAKAPRPAMKSFKAVGQICIDADTGKVLSEQNANVRHPPASVTKLMTIFVVLDAVKAGKIRLSTPVVASRNAQETGGTQVYLAEGEVNTVEDLLFALMLQSANDAAVALAERVGGNVENFVAMMNAKAAALGLTRTKYSTPHGLPVSKKDAAAGKQPDMTCAADLATLSRALIRTHPEVFRYTAAKTKIFRQDRFGVQPLPMGNHNKLLSSFPGCDGLKTGWTNAGASIVTTASRGNRRVIAVVLGGLVRAKDGGIDARTSQRERNQRAAELMFDGLKKLDALKYEPTPVQP